MGTTIYGSELAAEKKAQMREQIQNLEQQGKRLPCLAVILVGDDPASQSYVRGKEKACAEVGIKTKTYKFRSDISQYELECVIEACNKNPMIDGILLQLPLPNGLNEAHALQKIDPAKDVDGLHPENVARLYMNQKGFVPCTPRGIMEILKKMNVNLDGKHAVVVGRSKLVGAPVSRLLLNANATVTTCHSHTKNLKDICRQADVLIVAVGKPKMITSEYVKEGAYVIDVGVNRVDGKLCGDVAFDEVVEKAAAITPVPKGVGPMTICMLLENTLEAYFAKTAE